MSTTSNNKANPYRLSKAVVPTAYRLYLEPNLETATFNGSVAIDVDVKEGVSAIALNAVELEISAASLVSGAKTLVSSAPILDEQYETATLNFDEELPAGPATLRLAFTGQLNDQLHGFYRSTYDDGNGVSHTIATTQFEATDARRAFPCWDEPAFKATFQVTLVIAEELAAFSNTNEETSRSLGDGRREIQFAPTIVMSTYLVAFIVGPFEASPVTMAAGTPLRVVYPIGKGHLTEWAMEAAVHALEFFSDYFAIPYVGDKIDLVAIPDFAAGAMENLGCVTFRETELLIDRANASHSELERVVLVVNHELAHMWFGDLVTMDWWEGIWLNEAFATFMESLCSDAFRPEWKKWVGFNPERDVAFAVDGQHSTRPIEYEVISPNDCRGMFDVLTYVKGCAVLRMLEQYLGAETFRDGIRLYLQRHAYANTVTSDLWSALEAASGQPVGAIMDTWILQGGFPLISVDGDVVSQEPFSYGPSEGPSNIGTSWKVPVLVRSLDGGATTAHLLDAPSDVFASGGASVVNAGGSGFYRTAYSSEHLASIAARLDDLDELERAVLFSDTWASILVGRSSFVDLFTLAKGLAELDEPSTWDVVVKAVALVNRIVDESGRVLLAGVVHRLFGPVFARLGWEPGKGETSQAGELRATVINVLGTLGRDTSIMAEAASRFDVGSLRGDLADAIVAITMHQHRPGDVAACEERRKSAANPQDEQRYLFAPAGTDDVEVAMEVFNRAFGDVRTQDAPYLIGTLVRNRVAGPVVWKAMSERWAEAIERFPMGSPVAMAAGVVTFASDPQFARDVRSFHEQNPVPAGQQQVAQILDLMDLNVKVFERSRATLEASLAAFLD